MMAHQLAHHIHVVERDHRFTDRLSLLVALPCHSQNIARREAVQRLHDQGIAIGTHTLFPLGSTTGKPISPSAMSAQEVERLVGLGVDWIESDDPERLLAMIG